MRKTKKLFVKIHFSDFIFPPLVVVVLTLTAISLGDSFHNYAAADTGVGAAIGKSAAAITCKDGSAAPSGDPSQCVYCSDNSVAPKDASGTPNANLCFKNKPHCGSGTVATPLSINIGCYGKGNPIADAAFAIIRFLSDGVGLVLIGSIIVAGIQYSSSRGDPQATAKGVKRIQSNLLALLLYIFGYAILNYLIPGQVLH